MTNKTPYNFTPPNLALRYVAVCDVLGFKNKVEKVPLQDLARRYQALLNLINHILNSNNTLFPDSPEKTDFVDHAVFSDTILVWSAPISASATLLDLGPVSCFFDTCNVLLGAGIHYDMPLRVGVSYGEVCIDPSRSLFLGKPIVEAYLLEESQDWIGGACHKSCERAASFHSVKDDWRDVVVYGVPSHDGRHEMPALNWPRLTANQCPAKLREALEFPVDHPGRQKYLEALEFFSFSSKASWPKPEMRA